MSEPYDPYDDDDDESRRRRAPRRRTPTNPFDEFIRQFGDQFGGVSFDDIFKQAEVFFEDIFRRLGQQASPMDDGSNPPGFVWGFRMSMGPDGRPNIERFGNNLRQMSGGEVQPSDEREPLVDVIEDTNVVRVIAEIPGVRKQDIELSATDSSILIQATSKETALNRRYYKEVDLPCLIQPDSASAKFNNGVLEVELQKVKAEKRSTKVSVD